MYISKLRIKNFKCFDEVEIEFDPDFNLIIGENNSGKSTIFESLRLWQLAIQQFYMARTAKKIDGKYGFYRNFAFQPLNQNDLSFLRIDDINNVLNNKIYNKIVNKHFEIEDDYKTFYIELTFSNGTDFSKIPIAFRPGSRNTLYCKLDIDNEEKLKELSESLFKVMDIASNDTFRNRIRLAYIPPKFNLPNKETLLSDKNYILGDKLILGQSQLVVRNILHNWCEFDYQKFTKTVEEKNIRKSKNLLKSLKINENEFEKNFHQSIKPYIENVLGFTLNQKRSTKSPFLLNIENGLKEILNQDFNFKSYNNPLRNATLQIKNSVDSSEISQLGSGTINVLNILTVLNFNEQTIDKAATKCNILLLDEPDSHLHSNLQINLFNYLVTQSKENTKQIFIVTHNSSLISQFSNVLYIANNKKIHKPITINDYLENHLKNLDEAHYNVIKELNQAKSKLIDIDEKVKEDEKTYLIFEGPTDRNIFKIAFEKLYKKEFPFEIIDTVSSASTLTTYLNAHKKRLGFLIGVFDNDYEGRTQFANLNKVEFQNMNSYKKSGNKYAFLLPIPSYRELPFYKKHLTIEYMFTNDDLFLMLGSEYLIQEEGEEYKKIKGEDNKQAYVIPNNVKTLVSEKCKELPSNSFNSFAPFFEEIAKITKIELS